MRGVNAVNNYSVCVWVCLEATKGYASKKGRNDCGAVFFFFETRTKKEDRQVPKKASRHSLPTFIFVYFFAKSTTNAIPQEERKRVGTAGPLTRPMSGPVRGRRHARLVLADLHPSYVARAVGAGRRFSQSAVGLRKTRVTTAPLASTSPGNAIYLPPMCSVLSTPSGGRRYIAPVLLLLLFSLLFSPDTLFPSLDIAAKFCETQATFPPFF